MEKLTFGETLRQRFSPDPPPGPPRTAWRRLNRAKTDSGWPLLTANALLFLIFAVVFFTTARRSGGGLAFFSYVGAVSCALGVMRTTHVMWRVFKARRSPLHEPSSS